jgi:hypothetical protein
VHPDDAEWEHWRPVEVAARLANIDAPWCVAAGWAIDLFLGRERREHEDLEIAVPSTRFGEVTAALGELDLYVVGPATAVLVADAGKLLDNYHQTWGLDRSANVWRVDVFREPSDGDTWICRRDETIRLPYAELIEHTEDGIPYVRPEVVLLFKAKAARPKDEGDLAAVLPRLEPSRQRWLAETIELVHPGHFWLAELRR